MTISTDIIWYPDREVVVLLLQCIVALPSLALFSLFLLFLLLSPLFPLFLSAGKVYPAGKLGNFCYWRFFHHLTRSSLPRARYKIVLALTNDQHNNDASLQRCIPTASLPLLSSPPLLPQHSGVTHGPPSPLGMARRQKPADRRLQRARSQ